MGASTYGDLKSHLGHAIVVVDYEGENAAIECETCCEVLFDLNQETSDVAVDVEVVGARNWTPDVCREELIGCFCLLPRAPKHQDSRVPPPKKLTDLMAVLLGSESDEGCSDDLTVVSKSALRELDEFLQDHGTGVEQFIEDRPLPNGKAIRMSLDVIRTMMEAMAVWAEGGPPGVEHCLTVSTAHMPDEDPDFGNTRTVEHCNRHGEPVGNFVFLAPPLGDDLDLLMWVSENDDIPTWLGNLYLHALEHGCRYINFDQDAEILDGFHTYEW